MAFNEEELKARLDARRMPPEDDTLEFYAIMLTGDAEGRMSATYESHWIGWHDLERRIELRQASLVTARYAEARSKIGISSIFVLNDLDVILFLAAGGLGLVEKTLAEVYFPKVQQPFEAYPLGRSGFVDEALLEAGSLSRAPTKKKRMAILNRDKRRCRICGRRPDDDVDLELNVHHIRPWGEGGVTDSSNLITLCDTCHGGLDPHFDRSLFELVDQRDSLALLQSFSESVSDYRQASPLGRDF